MVVSIQKLETAAVSTSEKWDSSRTHHIYHYEVK